jgi:hypothetical protein
MNRCVVVLVGLFVASGAWGQASAPAKHVERVAAADGQAITEDELAWLVQGQLPPLKRPGKSD